MKIYLSSIYFLITTVTSVGYGDITGHSITEFVFQIFLLIIGIIAYSWLVSSLSNYVKENNQQNEIFNQKLAILNEIKLENSQFPKELYLKYLDMEDLGKINRFFLQFETPADAIDSLALLIKSNNVSIIEENKQMKIQITNPSIQKQFSIEIPKKEKDLKAELDTITPYIKSLHEKIDNLENQLKEKTWLVWEYKRCSREKMVQSNLILLI